MSFADDYHHLSPQQVDKIQSEYSKKVGRVIPLDDLDQYFVDNLFPDWFNLDLLQPLEDAEYILSAMGVPFGMFNQFIKSLEQDEIDKIWAGITNPESGIYIVVKSPNKKYGDFVFFNPNADARLKKSVTKKYTTFKIPASA